LIFAIAAGPEPTEPSEIPRIDFAGAGVRAAEPAPARTISATAATDKTATVGINLLNRML
jgi:hypothetical protein